MSWQAVNEHYRQRIADVFGAQQIMRTIGASLVGVEPGKVRIMAPYRNDLTQQHGYMHAGVVTTIVDTACGCAALTLMPVGYDVLAVEFKINFLLPAIGERFEAIGTVIKPGRRLTVCTGSVRAHSEGTQKEIAHMQATMMPQPPTD